MLTSSTVPLAAAALLVAGLAAPATAATLSRTAMVDGIEIFYREAGPADAPVVLLLHGFPSSSHMYRDLIPKLAEKYRVIAPDYPGFGYSAAPPLGTFPYSFAALAELIDHFTTTVGAKDYVLFMQDYGGPVGFRLAAAHPERVRGLIVQNAVANVEGWNPAVMAQLEPYWQHRDAATEQPFRAMLTPETTRFQYTQGATRPERLSPDAWTVDQAGLDRPGNADIQLQYFHDYQSNVAAYPAWGDYLERAQPPLLIVWGKNDPFFTLAGVDHLKALVPGAEVHLYDAGHFALETDGEEIAAATLAFLARLPQTD